METVYAQKYSYKPVSDDDSSNPSGTDTQWSDGGNAAGADIGGYRWEYDQETGQMVKTGTTDGSSDLYYDYGGGYKVAAYGGSGTGISTGGGQEVVVSSQGINEASQSLLSCADELSGVFDDIAVVTDSIGANVTGFESIENFVSSLRQINSTKDSLISKIKEFGNYLTTTVTTGYDEFIKTLGSIKIDTSCITSLISLLTGTSLGNNTFNSSGTDNKYVTSGGGSGSGNGSGTGSGNGGSSGDSEGSGSETGNGNDSGTQEHSAAWIAHYNEYNNIALPAYKSADKRLTAAQKNYNQINNQLTTAENQLKINPDNADWKRIYEEASSQIGAAESELKAAEDNYNGALNNLRSLKNWLNNNN